MKDLKRTFIDFSNYEYNNSITIYELEHIMKLANMTNQFEENKEITYTFTEDLQTITFKIINGIFILLDIE